MNQTSSSQNPPKTFDLNKIIQNLTPKQGKYLKPTSQEIKCVLRVSRQIFLTQNSLLRIDAPITVCGDIHGQYRDLVRIFEEGGFPGQGNCYLFLGDYVDRGRSSIECMCLLLCYKIKYPKNVFLLRGNHESPSLNKVYGFYNECCTKYSPSLWKTFLNTFDSLPAAALISNRILCMHGGLSPELHTLDQINEIKRPCNIDCGLLSDLVWSDPDDSCGLFGKSARGAGFAFGREVVEIFCQVNEIQLVVRGHEIVEDGYRFSFGRKLVTIFSAPNYCNKFTNDAGVLKIDQNFVCSIQRFSPMIKLNSRLKHTISEIKIQQGENSKFQEDKHEEEEEELGQKKTKKIYKKKDIIRSIKQLVKSRRIRSRSVEIKPSNVLQKSPNFMDLQNQIDEQKEEFNQKQTTPHNKKFTKIKFLNPKKSQKLKRSRSFSQKSFNKNIIDLDLDLDLENSRMQEERSESVYIDLSMEQDQNSDQDELQKCEMDCQEIVFGQKWEE